MDFKLQELTEKLQNSHIRDSNQSQQDYHQNSLTSDFKQLSFESFHEIEDSITDKILQYKKEVPLIIVKNDVWVNKISNYLNNGSHLTHRTVIYTEEYFVKYIIDNILKTDQKEVLVINLKKEKVSIVHIVRTETDF